MVPVLVVALLACLATAGAGVRLLRSPVAWERFEPTARVREEAPKPRRSLVDRFAVSLLPLTRSMVPDASFRRYQRRLEAAGSPEGLTAESFLARRTAYALSLGGAGLLLLLIGQTVTGLLVAVTGGLLQDLWLRAAVRRRQDRLERDLPDFLDVLSVTVEAGLGFQSALRRIADAFEGPLAEEVETALRQMSFGMSRREAFEALRTRNESEVLDSFVVALRQAEELGAPLSDTLRSMADDLREQWNQRARRKAAQAVPRVSLIVAFTLVPASIIMIVAAMLAATGQPEIVP